MLKIPYSEFSFSFSRSSGAGGQNVNKVNSRATLAWDINNSTSLPLDVKERFIAKYSRHIFNSLVIINSQKHRTQKLNVDDCISKLHEMLRAVEVPPKVRRPTKPKKSAVLDRLNGKNIRSKIKKLRQEKF